MTETSSQMMLHYQQRFNNFLENYFIHAKHGYDDIPALQNANLLEAMSYACENGGKRIRPLLVYAGAQAVQTDFNSDDLDYLATAIEFIHCYSLVHDDLPAMDNDDLRRGQATCHRKYDEATAILVGDALQAEAFHLITQTSCSDAIKIKLIETLSRAASYRGLVGGQALDLAATNKSISLDALKSIHQLKTGALIIASVKCGALLAGATTAQLDKLETFARLIGLAFQVQDDILDIESSTQVLGKQQGADQALNKSTYPKLMSLPQAKQYLHTLYDEALHALDDFEQCNMLQALSAFIIKREF